MTNTTSFYDHRIKIFKGLTHPIRLAILEILRDGEHCVCHMEAHLGLRQAYISQQLSVLREAGLILDRRDGWNIYYRIADLKIYDAMDAVQMLAGETGETRPKEPAHCPCPMCNPS